MQTTPLSLAAPFDREQLRGLCAGQKVLVTGRIYTARDAAHQRLHQLLDAGQPLPIDLVGNCIYYAGPTPEKPGQVIGACGPTTSARVDPYTPRLLECGLAAMVGKGTRSAEVVAAMVQQGAVYFAATGGAGALLAQSVTAATVVAFADLGCEAIRALDVENMPLIVAIDSRGHSVYVA